MITRTNAFQTSDEKTHATLEDAQRHELSLLFTKEDFGGAPVVGSVAAAILEHAVKVRDILTTTATSKPRARKVNGGSKKRKVEVAALQSAVNRELQDAKQ